MSISKVNRLIQLIILLTGNNKYTMDDLSRKFDCSERTLFRDFNELETNGFMLERGDGWYRLSHEKDVNKLFHFTHEEAAILFDMLQRMDQSTETSQRLVKKLHAFYDMKVLDKIRQNDELGKIRSLSEAIQKRQRVRLLNYKSSNSSSIEDRLVEPFEFSPNYQYIWAFDTDDLTNKRFRLSRIGSVELTEARWFHGHEHRPHFVDVFRMSAAQPVDEVELRLTLRAYNLLREEFPLSEQFIREEGLSHYLLKVPIADYRGVGRLVMGLLGEIEIVGSVDFRDYIRGELVKFSTKYEK